MSGDKIIVEVYKKHSAMCNGVASYKSTSILFTKEYPANRPIAEILRDIRSHDQYTNDGLALISNLKTLKANQLISELIIREDSTSSVNLTQPPAPAPAPKVAVEYAVTHGFG